MARAAPAGPLRPYVREYVGWSDTSRAISRRRQLPSGAVPLIVNFGARVRERKARSDELVRTGGRVRIAEVVGRSGWSERHLAARFREEIGLAPKAFARTLRFAAAVRALKTAAAPVLADLAQACGYYDQAHFTRDVGAFAGATPTELIVSRFLSI